MALKAVRLAVKLMVVSPVISGTPQQANRARLTHHGHR
jgi:hypothetical protein